MPAYGGSVRRALLGWRRELGRSTHTHIGRLPLQAHPMNSFRIRTAAPADLDLVAPLFDAYRQFYEQAPDAAVARHFIRDRLQRDESTILLALNDKQQAVGFAQLYPIFCSIDAKPIYSLSDLFVVPEMRRSGAGRALLLAAERHARNTGRTRLELTTAHTNKTAQAVYESLGWRRDEVYAAYAKDVQT